jgi:phthalate 4,5-cis-dihydrodiol dehydrogenase
MWVLSCERAVVRPLPTEVLIHAENSVVREKLAPPEIPRAGVIDELHAAVFDDRPPLHDGAWGRATLEVCLAMLRSAREEREIIL